MSNVYVDAEELQNLMGSAISLMDSTEKEMLTLVFLDEDSGEHFFLRLSKIDEQGVQKLSEAGYIAKKASPLKLVAENGELKE